MGTTLLYTKPEIDLLYQSLMHEYTVSLADDVRRAIRDIDSPDILLKERCLLHAHLDTETSSRLENQWLFGESRVFVIFYDRPNLDFEFWTRHLKNFLYKTELRKMPLMINTYFIKTLASWRLQIAK